MTLSDLAAIGSFVSGVAVVVTLILLLLQMRQNTQAVRAAASQAHAANFQNQLTPLAANAQNARMFRLGIGGVEQLNEDERTQFLLICSGIFRFYDAARLQWRHGQLDDGHWHSVEAQLGDFIRHPGVQTYWAMRRHWHSPDFRDWVDGLPKEKPEREFYDLPAKSGAG